MLKPATAAEIWNNETSQFHQSLLVRKFAGFSSSGGAQKVVLRHDAATPLRIGLVQAIMTTYQQKYLNFRKCR